MSASLINGVILYMLHNAGTMLPVCSRCVEPRCDPVHAGGGGGSFPGGQWQRDTDHDHGLPLSCATPHLSGVQGVSQSRTVGLGGSHVTITHMGILQGSTPFGVNLSPEFINLYFLYTGWGLLFLCWWQQHFEFQPTCVAMEGRSNVVRNTHARLQISFPTKFLSLNCTSH